MESITSILILFSIVLCFHGNINAETDSCELETVGSAGDLSAIDIPPKNRISSTTFDTWMTDDLMAYEVYGFDVYMSEVYDFLEYKNHPRKNGNLEKNYYQLRIRADTFYCDKKEDDPKNEYEIPGIKKLEIISRKLISDDCKIILSQPEWQFKGDILTKESDGTSAGGKGTDGKKGEDGKNGRSARVVTTYQQSIGKLSIVAEGGKGGKGYAGTSGGDGKKGYGGAHQSGSKMGGPCQGRRGGKGGTGGNGGEGGEGGKGGDGGNGGSWSVYTPDGETGSIELSLKGCPGEPGEGGSGGKGGTAGEGGLGGTSKVGTYNPRGGCCCWREVRTGSTGDAGKDGEDGDNGKTGKTGIEGEIKANKIAKGLYDEDILDLLLRKADDLYQQQLITEAAEIYQFAIDYGNSGLIKQYCVKMKQQIDSGLNYYGFAKENVVAEDLGDIKDRVETMMELAKTEDERIDKNLYRTFENDQRKINYEGLTHSLMANNRGLIEETRSYIVLYMDQRRRVISGIQDIETKMSELMGEIQIALEESTEHEDVLRLIGFMRCLVAYGEISVADSFDQTDSMILGDSLCGKARNQNILNALKETALSFEQFKDTKKDWTKIDLSLIPPKVMVELSKTNKKDDVGDLGDTLICLFQANTPGFELEGAIDAYLDFATTRFTFIGEIYEIDLTVAKYKLREKYLEERNKDIQGIQAMSEFQTTENNVVRRLRLTEDLLDSFKMTAAFTLKTLYLFTDSHRFTSLWNFRDCLNWYSPTTPGNPRAQSYFDGYTPLHNVYKRVLKFNERLKRQLREQAHPQAAQAWTYEINDDTNKKFMVNLRQSKLSTFYFDPSTLCEVECSNFRLLRVYAELLLKNKSKHEEDFIIVRLEHLGDNNFFIGSMENGPIIMKQNKVLKVLIRGLVQNPVIKACKRGNVCPNVDTKASDRLIPACKEASTRIKGEKTSLKTSEKSNRKTLANQIPVNKPKNGPDTDEPRASRKKRLSGSVNTACRSPFATYSVKIPIGTRQYTTAQRNPAYTDLSNIIGVRILFEVKYWTDYPASPENCEI